MTITVTSDQIITAAKYVGVALGGAIAALVVVWVLMARAAAKMSWW
jgi:hypothetical protein